MQNERCSCTCFKIDESKRVRPRIRRYDVAYAISADPAIGGAFLLGITSEWQLPDARCLYAAARQLHRARRQRLRDAERSGGPSRNATHANSPYERRVAELSSKISRLAHDMRLPISALRATTAWIRVGLSAEPIQPHLLRDRLATLDRQTNILERFCDDVLAVEHGRTPASPNSPLSLAEIVQDALESYGDAAAARLIRVHAAVKCNVPVDASARSIAHNLIHNATRHARKNIWVNVGVTGNAAFFDIEDDGPGLPTGSVVRQLSRQNLSRQGTGWGLGLESAIRSAEAAGGSLQAIAPARAAGGHFLLVLPQADGHLRRIDNGGDLAQK